ncbi:MAG: hypothetical protein M3144_13000, partial [Actinomycetota bacterium]|nr:hypothetical protein [Actinomycetota bacterium]
VGATNRYWAEVWRAAGDRGGRLAAWRGLVATAGAGRARWLVANHRPLNPNDEPRRARPDQVFLVVAGDEPLPGPERTAAAKYWRLLRRARSDADSVAAAEADLQAAVGPERAAAIRSRRPAGFAVEPGPSGEDVNVAFLDLPKVPETETKPGSWTRAARARLLPDRFVVLGYVGGVEVINAIGEACADSLVVSPDPSTPLEEQLRLEEDGTLRIPPDLAWLTDFEAAVRLGMGLRIKLDERARNGLDRLVVLGLRLKTGPERGAAELEELLTHHHQSRTGLSLLPQGTPTNNTEKGPARHEDEDEAETSFVDVFERPHHGVGPDDWARKTDGQWLAELLGIDPRALRSVRHADATDQREARALNMALWPATWGYFLQTMLHPILGSDAVAATREFFVSYVSGRGPAPTLRIGRQPYGILPTSALSRFEVPRNNRHRTLLLQVVEEAATDWHTMAAQVAHVGMAGDPHALLLDILGLHPVSVEFHQRYGQSVEDYFNRLNLAGQGTNALDALSRLGMAASLRQLLARLGYDTKAPDPDLARRLFVGRQHALKGPLVDDRPLSETEPVRPYTVEGDNYLRWLERSARRSLELIRLEEGFVGDTPPQALLYLLLRHALLLAWQDAGLRLAAEKRRPDQAALTALRRDPPFVHISRRAQRSESRFGQLYSPDPEITGEPDTLVGEYITRVVG